MDPVFTSGFFFNEGMSCLNEFSEMLYVFLRDIGAGKGVESEHICESFCIKFVVFCDELTELYGIGYFDRVSIFQKILIEGVVASACF